jgi:hypothetical protein
MNKLIFLLVGAVVVASASSNTDKESNKMTERELESAPVSQAKAQESVTHSTQKEEDE